MTRMLAFLLLFAPCSLVAGDLPTDEEISRSLREGRAWLLEQAMEPGFGKEVEAGLVLFALLRSGVPDRTLAPVFAELKKREFSDATSVYEAGVYALALEARSLSAKDADFPWRSRVRSSAKPEAVAELQRIADLLLARESQGTPGAWGYTASRQAEVDNSNSQFAVYGLAAASRSGVEVSPKVWGRILTHWIQQQRVSRRTVVLELGWGPFARLGPTRKGWTVATRGWGYGDRLVRFVRPYASMTGAGVSSLAYVLERIESERRGGKKGPLVRRAEAAVHSGLGWLQMNLEAALQPDRPSGVNGLINEAFPFYSIWSLEKAFDSTHVQSAGGRDWWRLGAKWILARQEPDGPWGAEPGSAGWGNVGRIRTSFALLFLSRATLPAAGATEAVIEVASTEAPQSVPSSPSETVTGIERATWDVVTLEGGERVALGQALALLRTSEGATSRKQLLAQVKTAWPKLAAEWRGGLLPQVLELAEAGDGKARSWARKALHAMVEKRAQRERIPEFARLWAELYRAAMNGRAADLEELVPLACAKGNPVWLQLRALRSVRELYAFEHVAPLIELPVHADLELRTRSVDVLSRLHALKAPALLEGKLGAKARKKASAAWSAWLERVGTPGPGALLQRDVALYLSGKDGARDSLESRREDAIALCTALRQARGLGFEARCARLLQELAE